MHARALRLALRAAVTLVASFAEGEWNVLILDHMLDLPLHREHKERDEVPVPQRARRHPWLVRRERPGAGRGPARRGVAYMSSMGQKTGMLKTEKKVRKKATQKALVSEYQNLNSGSLPW